MRYVKTDGLSIPSYDWVAQWNAMTAALATEKRDKIRGLGEEEDTPLCYGPCCRKQPEGDDPFAL